MRRSFKSGASGRRCRGPSVPADDAHGPTSEELFRSRLLILRCQPEDIYLVLRSVIRYSCVRWFMASPLTLRLEKKTRLRIARIASRRQISTSEVIRQAIEAWVERQEPIAAPYEVMADLIGVVNGGNPNRSTETGRRFREILKGRGKRG